MKDEEEEEETEKPPVVVPPVVVPPVVTPPVVTPPVVTPPVVVPPVVAPPAVTPPAVVAVPAGAAAAPVVVNRGFNAQTAAGTQTDSGMPAWFGGLAALLGATGLVALRHRGRLQDFQVVEVRPILWSGRASAVTVRCPSTPIPMEEFRCPSPTAIPVDSPPGPLADADPEDGVPDGA